MEGCCFQESQGSGISKNMNFGPEAVYLYSPVLLPSSPGCDERPSREGLHPGLGSGISTQIRQERDTSLAEYRPGSLHCAHSSVPEESVSSSPGPAAATSTRLKEGQVALGECQVQKEKGVLSADRSSQ